MEAQDFLLFSKRTRCAGAEAQAGGASAADLPPPPPPPAPAPPAEAPESFAALGVAPWLCETLRSLAIALPTRIQQALVPALLAGRDAVGCAPTGSGKTAAFALPIVQRLADDPFGVFALVLTPTRELAFQLTEQFNVLGAAFRVRVCTLVGGLSAVAQTAELSRKPHVVVATPGRLLDILQTFGASGGAVDLRRLRFFVLDEADRLLSGSLVDEVRPIFSFVQEAAASLPSPPARLQKVLVSATMGSLCDSSWHFLNLADGFSTHAFSSSPYETVLSCSQKFLLVPSAVKSANLVYLLANDFCAVKNAVIFVSKCKVCQLLFLLLQAFDEDLGRRCTQLHSQMTQKERLASIARFKSGHASFLITTDLGSRGLDIPNVQLVLNYDLPNSPTDYVHRVGRTARAGRSGTALSLLTEHDIALVQHIESKIDRLLEEHVLPENKVLDILDKVSQAKRTASMKMHEMGFGAKKLANSSKRLSR